MWGSVVVGYGVLLCCNKVLPALKRRYMVIVVGIAMRLPFIEFGICYLEFGFWNLNRPVNDLAGKKAFQFFEVLG